MAGIQNKKWLSYHLFVLILVCVFVIVIYREDLMASLTVYEGRDGGRFQDQVLAVTELSGGEFNASGIPLFMSTFQDVTKSKDMKLVMMCAVGHGLCGGISDRASGIPFAVILALVGHRQLILDTSLLMNGPAPANLTDENHYFFVDGGCQNMGMVQRILNDNAPTIYITCNCMSPIPPLSTTAIASTSSAFQNTIGAIQKECEVCSRCGAGALHRTETYQAHIRVARRVAESLSTWLPVANYTVLHVRAGGSLVSVGGLVKAAPWDDGYASDIPQWWIDGFQGSSYQDCKKSVALVSDSVRVLSEIRFAAQDRLMVSHCCVQALHRDRFPKRSFFIQEVVDLFIMARSRRIVGGMGGFSTLGKYWLGGDGPDLVIKKSKQDVRSAMRDILSDAQCTNIEVVV